MSRARRRPAPRRRARRSRRRTALAVLFVLAASVAIVAALVRVSQPPAQGPFHFPTPAGATPPSAEIDPGERRQLDAILDGMRGDPEHGAGAPR